MKNKGFAHLVLLVVLVVLAGLLLWSVKTYFYIKSPEYKTIDDSGIIPSSSTIVSQTQEPSVNWKTYNNSEYHISFQYPDIEGLKTVDCSKGKTVGIEEPIFVMKPVNSKYKDCDGFESIDWVFSITNWENNSLSCDSYADVYNRQLSEVLINGIQVPRCITHNISNPYLPGTDKYQDQVLLLKNGTTFNFFLMDESYRAQIDHLYSTFKFTNSEINLNSCSSDKDCGESVCNQVFPTTCYSYKCVQGKCQTKTTTYPK